MIQRASISKALLLLLLIATASLLRAEALYSEKDMLISPAIITSLRGKVQFDPAEKSARSLKPHQTIFPHESSFRTNDKSHAFAVFSNGVAIGIDNETEMQVKHYRQLPFLSNKESQQYEPSVSELRIQLDKGSLAVVSDHLSPLSKFTIELPIGELRIHSASAYINHDETGVHITAYSGSLTYYYPDEKGREFIAEPTSMRVSNESVSLGRHAETLTVEEAPEAWRIFTLATENAGKRVFYKAGGKKANPTPVLIVPNGYFEQPEARPYELIK